MLFTNYTRLGIMKAIYFLCSLLCCFSVTAQLDFDMDVTAGLIGNHADVTYTVTNSSTTNTISNVTINHDDAVVTTFIISTSLGPGMQVTATGSVPVSGDPVNGSLPIIGSTQATVTGDLNGTMITELSDGIDIQGNRVTDGISYYGIAEPQSYGFIYLDMDLDNSYTPNVDMGISGAVINAINSDGISIQAIANEAGWWNIEPPANVPQFMDDFMATIDQNSFPTAVNSYQLIEGTSPFQLSLLFAFNFQFKHGYADAPASIDDVPSIAIYPNPLQGNILRLKNLDQGVATLYALDGKQIWSGDFIDNHIRFADLNSGIYLLRIESLEQTDTLKLVVE